MEGRKSTKPIWYPTIALFPTRRKALLTCARGAGGCHSGGRVLVRGNAAAAYESGSIQRLILIEFESLERALALYNSPAYAEARTALDGAADRDMRVIEGL
jgi:hypothetical protein